MTTDAALHRFFSSSHFAVVGASSDPKKFGNIVLQWYLEHSLPVTPINSSSKSIDVSGRPYNAVPNLASLPGNELADTSVSIITQPDVTLKILEQASGLGISAVWMQPGSFDDKVLRFAREQVAFKAVLAGHGGRGTEGWCVLMDGEDGLKAAGKL